MHSLKLLVRSGFFDPPSQRERDKTFKTYIRYSWNSRFIRTSAAVGTISQCIFLVSLVYHSSNQQAHNQCNAFVHSFHFFYCVVSDSNYWPAVKSTRRAVAKSLESRHNKLISNLCIFCELF